MSFPIARYPTLLKPAVNRASDYAAHRAGTTQMQRRTSCSKARLLRSLRRVRKLVSSRYLLAVIDCSTSTISSWATKPHAHSAGSINTIRRSSVNHYGRVYRQVGQSSVVSMTPRAQVHATAGENLQHGWKTLTFFLHRARRAKHRV